MPEPDVSASPSPAPGATEPPIESKSLVDQTADLVQTVVTYVRQETGDLVREKVVLPTQKAGATVGLAIGVALLLFLGIGYVSVGALILLASWIGWPAALFLVGGILIVGSASVAYFRARMMQS